MLLYERNSYIYLSIHAFLQNIHMKNKYLPAAYMESGPMSVLCKASCRDVPLGLDELFSTRISIAAGQG